ncbi:ribosome-associated protein [Ekhidna lutea]|uniref:Ribosomal silencing factor RsfS n=1 Tax=Ekhidna lutea TaxID=447679 RepID=A0A239JBC6_EKHLU|nr:ribosome silencing factor [Ekhidna lutea]SNT02583.1 ribosome-associated protein [Ekhidna lutea]
MNQQVSKDVSSEILSEWVVDGMLDKKGIDVVVMDLRDVKHAIADYFVICSGNSDTQIDAISDSIEEQIHKQSKQNPWKREGQQNKEWILLDYVDVVAHIFNKEKRRFYGLEELWGDAKITRIEEN